MINDVFTLESGRDATNETSGLLQSVPTSCNNTSIACNDLSRVKVTEYQLDYDDINGYLYSPR